MTAVLLFLSSALSLAAVVLLVMLLRRSPDANTEARLSSLIEKSLERNERALRDETSRNRDEIARSAKDLREELGNSLKSFGDSLSGSVAGVANQQKNLLDTFANQLVTLTSTNEERLFKMSETIEERLGILRDGINSNARDNREEIGKSLKSFEDRFAASVNDFNALQKQKFDDLTNRLGDLAQTTEQKLEKMRETVEGRLKTIQDDTSEKLEKMRATVDEKLHKTLDERLGETFRIVSERLEQVHKGLGEMQNLAVGVGDLKKVLSNVKTRGILGEITLESILEQLLTPDQYEKNVATKKGSRDVVEFAIKLPGKEDGGDPVYLPLDAKFPTETYHALVEAYECGDHAAVEEASKLLENSIKRFAKDIRDKYIDPPHTTDFGILFLPVEGLYAEVVRRTSLLETLNREYKINITGPTTLASMLNSLQMGFKTLAIEKRSSEVWKILGAVKAEFEKFGGVLEKAQKKISEASSEIDELVGKRTRQIQRKLKHVEELPNSDSKLYLPDASRDGESEEAEEKEQLF